MVRGCLSSLLGLALSHPELYICGFMLNFSTTKWVPMKVSAVSHFFIGSTAKVCIPEINMFWMPSVCLQDYRRNGRQEEHGQLQLSVTLPLPATTTEYCEKVGADFSFVKFQPHSCCNGYHS